MAAHSTHQAFKGSGKTAQMTAGEAPHCETADLPARRFGRPPESAHPILRDNPLYRNPKRQSRAKRRSNPEIAGLPTSLDCLAALAMTAALPVLTSQGLIKAFRGRSLPQSKEPAKEKAAFRRPFWLV